MLFNSPEFLFAFLPVTLGVFFALGRLAGENRRVQMAWLVAASLFFYAWWDPRNLLLLGFSLVFNYLLSQHLIGRATEKNPDKPALVLGVVVNLALIAWFKYANFFAANVGALFGQPLSFGRIVLPLAISFFTFQQISYLVDGYRGQVQRCPPLDYAMVVTFFPHLIAGPIVRYQDVLPQFREPSVFRFDADRIGAGLAIFCCGLFKKMVFADSISPYANLAFDAAAQGVTLTFTEAWVGALAYTCQLYFDFSGYSDMAIGLAWMFGIRFSLNFFSPYKALSIIEFWRRWHITLSSFLRDYLYISLGGNRRGNRHVNLLATMLLGGLWHGAGWNFVIWGGVHGSALVANHQWRAVAGNGPKALRLPAPLAWLLTFLFVVVAWVFFRATTTASALQILASMVGMNGFQLPDFLQGLLGFMTPYGVSFAGFTANVGIPQKYSVGGIAILMIVALGFPNTQQWMGALTPALGVPKTEGPQPPLMRWCARICWRPTRAWSLVMGLMAGICVLCLTRVSQFIYFQF